MRSAVRKVVRVGKRSYAVVIPKKWVHLLKINPGDSVYAVLNDDGTLTIAPLRTPRGAPPKLSASVGLPRGLDGRLVSKVILALYSAGLTSVTLSPGESLDSTSVPNELASVEPTRSGAAISFRELRASPEEVLEAMVGRVGEALKLFSENLGGLSAEVWEEIHRIEEELDAMAHLAIRLTVKRVVAEALSKGLESEVLVKSILDVLVAKALEDLSDCVDRSAHRIKELSAISKDYADLYARVRDLSHEAVECYLYGCSPDHILSNLARASKLRGELKELMTVSVPPLLPLLSEVEIAVTLVEDVLEAALITSYRW